MSDSMNNKDFCLRARSIMDPLCGVPNRECYHTLSNAPGTSLIDESRRESRRQYRRQCSSGKSPNLRECGVHFETCPLVWWMSGAPRLASSTMSKLAKVPLPNTSAMREHDT